MRFGRQALLGLLPIISCFCPVHAAAGEALIAVAANFAAPAAQLKAAFEADQDFRLVLSTGSTGKLYAQIRHGAPYDAFLAADTVRPAILEEEGLAVSGSRFSYARGRLGIWIQGSSGDIDNHPVRLAGLKRVALANPRLAPYGVAAMNVLDHLGVRAQLADRLVLGENVAQAYAMVASGAAQGGLLGWSLILAGGAEEQSWQVPESWHLPVEQEAVLLNHGQHNTAAIAFLDYLRSAPGRDIIRTLGYSVP